MSGRVKVAVGVRACLLVLFVTAALICVHLRAWEALAAAGVAAAVQAFLLGLYLWSYRGIRR